MKVNVCRIVVVTLPSFLDTTLQYTAFRCIRSHHIEAPPPFCLARSGGLVSIQHLERLADLGVECLGALQQVQQLRVVHL